MILSPFKECKDMPIQPAMAQGIAGSIQAFDCFDVIRCGWHRRCFAGRTCR